MLCSYILWTIVIILIVLDRPCNLVDRPDPRWWSFTRVFTFSELMKFVSKLKYKYVILMSQWRCLWYVWVCMRPCVGCLGRLHDWVCRLFMHVLLCWKVESSLLFKSFLRELLEVVRMHLNVIGNYEWDMKRIISLSYTWRMVSLEANQTNTLFNSNT